MNCFEIEDEVMKRFPVTEEEQRCEAIKAFMKKVRGSYREKLKNKGRAAIHEPGKQETIQQQE